MLTGYTDRLSARPGETLSFMVSTDASRFNAEIVRLLHGDTDPRGPGRREFAVGAEVDGGYPGMEQKLFPGSFIIVADHPDLRLSGDFTLFAWIRPTRLASGEQVILSKEGVGETGYALGLSDTGRLFLRLGTARIEGATPVLERRWQWVAARYEANTGQARLSAGFSAHDQSLAEDFGGAGYLPPAISSDAPLLIAASMRHGQRSAYYNGLIADPCMFGKWLDDAELGDLAGGVDFGSIPKPCIAAWDFSIGSNGTRIHDAGGRAFDGETHQSPVRAMTGPYWSGETDDPKSDPRGYCAVHFHEDSLSDAGWRPSFAFTVPDDLPSGVYAARLTAGDETEDLPFLVCPPRGVVTAPLALLVPTFTYLAYGNEMWRDYGLNCLYDRYVDGAGVPLASLRHPIKTFRPGRGLLKSVTGAHFGRHLCADLYAVDWLDVIGQPVDIITDHELHCEGLGLLKQYKAVMTGSHPEYVSGQMLDALEIYLKGGGSLAYLGGNGFYSVTSLSDDGGMIEVRRPNGTRPWPSNPGESHHQLTGEPGGLWRFRGRAPQRLVGVGFTAQGWTSRDDCGLPRPYRQTGDRSRPLVAELLAGIGEDEMIGDFETLGLGVGAAGDEVDRADLSLGTPAHAQVLATATGFSADYQLVIDERRDVNEAATLPGNPLVRSDIVCFETAAGGLVFSVGSMQWFSALSHNGYDNTVSKMTRNVLRRMLG
ncbi:N,N-dimethylformamidase beta subunit family domain-containing protein [Mesorhizobium sp.]|uniref:N,N-dimethylformamidase beta subunit family domain-containing protein n=1 Tax=Mesorhizobium sp. TaxID=1871066 RepID=UPI0025E77645|nr:N,N-dimethylformamidase beta subunit family domain-containing protein [Mesorhizobium sp.]